MSIYPFERWWIAHIALVVLTFVASVVLFLCTFCLCRRRKDPARTAFTYLKVALALFILFTFLDFCAYALALAYTRYREDYVGSIYDSPGDVLKAIFLARTHCFTVARFFDNFVDVFVFFILARLSSGIIIASSGAADTFSKILRFASYGIAVVLSAVNLAGFGVRTKFNEDYYDDSFFFVGSGDDDLLDEFNTSRQLDFSFRVLVFVLAVAMVGRAVMVKLQTKNEPQVKAAGFYLIGCAILWLLRTCYNVASYATLYNISDASKDGYYESYFDILDVVLAIWPQFTLLCLVFFLGTQKRGGLWSTEQPFMSFNPAPGQQQTAWGYGYNATQNVPPVQQQQPLPTQTSWSQSQQQPQYTEQQYQQPPVPQSYYQPPQTHQNVQGYPPQQQYSQPQYSSYSETNTTRSPPPHEDTIGLNHQADGTPPQAQTRPYTEKGY